MGMDIAIAVRQHLCLLLLAAFSPIVALSQQAEIYPDPQSLTIELHRIERAIQEGHGDEVASRLPSSWTVLTPERRYTIPTRPLRDYIDTPADAEAWLASLAHQLEAWPAAQTASPAAPARLKQILARSEFSGVKPPGMTQLFWQALRSRILEWIDRFFSLVGADTMGGKFLFGVAAIAAIVFLEAWLLGFWRNRRRHGAAGPEAVMPVQTWRKWALAAREAADRADTRTAIHCCYLAAVVRLQEVQALPDDFTSTPREFLHLIPHHYPFHAPLAALTSTDERIWYANRPASSRDFDESFRHLEEMGCRL